MCFILFIVGYIMGLGDRHVQNILIDKQSAELIHIDLGNVLYSCSPFLFPSFSLSFFPFIPPFIPFFLPLSPPISLLLSLLLFLLPSILNLFSNTGVAFEQGRTLPTPEVIPFRLTRDLVSGMGLTGVVGVFQRCCEETMEVMRTSHEELRTIVEVSSVLCGMRLLACACVG